MNNSKYNLGLVSVSFRKNTPKEILEAMKKAGLSWIEWGSDIHAPCRDFEKIDEIVKLQNEYNVKCSSYGTYFRLGLTPIEELGDYIIAAKRLGTDVLRLWCGTKNGAEMTAEEKDALLKDCVKAANLAEDNDVILCMECHNDTFTENPYDAVWLMNEINSQNFRMYWQPFQRESFEWNIESAKLIAPYTKYLHVFNWKDSDRFPLSEAVDVWKEYMRNFHGSHTLLLEFMPNDEIEELENEYRALKIIAEEDNI